MFKKIETITISKFYLIGLLLLALPLAACGTLADAVSAAPTGATERIASVDTTAPVDTAGENVRPAAQAGAEVSVAEVTQTDLTNSIDSATVPELSIDEIADLQFMREEEKLARDVYLALYAQWGTPVFQNIAASEQVHMDAILGLINQYGLEDPAAGNDAGIFNDPNLQTLYDQLIATGSQSLANALLVGTTIEEIDILDLQGSLVQTDNGDIVPVYQSLLAGSENHLRAFVSSWERQTGGAYQPQHLSQDEYADIMTSSSAGYGQGGSGGGQGQGGQGQGGNGNRGQGGQGRGRSGNGNNGNIDNNLGGFGGRGKQSTTSD